MRRGPRHPAGPPRHFRRAGTASGPAPGTPPGFPPAENTKAQLEGGGDYQKSYIYNNLRPWAQQRYHTTEWELDDLGQRCQLMGIFRQGLGGGATFRFIESTPGKFYRTSGTYEETGLHTVRFGSTTPLNFRPVYQGDFRARWEGETLVIESQGYNDKTWILTDRWPHTESFRVIERYRLVGDGSYLELRLFMDDHRAFERADDLHALLPQVAPIRRSRRKTSAIRRKRARTSGGSATSSRGTTIRPSSMTS